jgi:hypothetical protein
MNLLGFIIWGVFIILYGFLLVCLLMRNDKWEKYDREKEWKSKK